MDRKWWYDKSIENNKKTYSFKRDNLQSESCDLCRGFHFVRFGANSVAKVHYVSVLAHMLHIYAGDIYKMKEKWLKMFNFEL